HQPVQWANRWRFLRHDVRSLSCPKSSARAASTLVYSYGKPAETASLRPVGEVFSAWSALLPLRLGKKGPATVAGSRTRGALEFSPDTSSARTAKSRRKSRKDIAVPSSVV